MDNIMIGARYLPIEYLKGDYWLEVRTWETHSLLWLELLYSHMIAIRRKHYSWELEGLGS